MTQKRLNENFVEKINSLSFRQAFIWIFLAGNIGLGFVSRVFIGAILRFDLGVWFRHLNLLVVASYTIFSLVFVYRKAIANSVYSKNVIRTSLYLYIALCLLVFFSLGFFSPLSLFGYYLFQGVINGNWAFDFFDGWITLIRQNSGE